MMVLTILLIVIGSCRGFVLDKITMDAGTFAACSTCDARADRKSSEVVANALRDYLTQNHLKMIINSKDGVEVTKSLPNEKINTGHSCSKTAEARNIKVNAKMTNDKGALDSLNMDYIDFIQNAIITGDVPHKVTISSDIRVWFGFKFFGKCKKYARKTCGVSGTSTGMNHITVNLQASDTTTRTLPDGTDVLQFKLHVNVEGKPKPKTYTPFKSTNDRCRILGINIGSSYRKYFDRYANGNNGVNKIRGTDLIKRLENLLQAKFDDTVTVPINIVGGGRKKRAAQNGCQRMKCPAGFSRLGNTKRCSKFFYTRKPNCAVYGIGANLYQYKWRNVTFYWCLVNMIPA